MRALGIVIGFAVGTVAVAGATVLGFVAGLCAYDGFVTDAPDKVREFYRSEFDKVINTDGVDDASKED